MASNRLGDRQMERLEERVRVLERQVSRYRVLNRLMNILVAAVLLGCAAFVISNLMSLKGHLQTSVGQSSRWDSASTVRAKRLEIIDEATSRPVCVLRAYDGGGRVEVFSRDGRALGNRGLVVRSADGTAFPK
jgi:hypothetical protein